MSGRKIPNFELKSAIYTELDGNIDYKVIESSRLDKPYPFVRIGPIFGGQWDAKNESGQELVQRFDCWSKVDSEEEVSNMMQQICDKIGFTNDDTTDHLTLTNWYVVGQFLDGCESIPDIDEKIPLRHGILDIRFVLRQK